MKHLVLKLILLTVLFFAIDEVFTSITDRYTEGKVDHRLENLLKGLYTKDIIVVGSSRGLSGIIASEMEKFTGLSSYNLSYLLSDIEFHEFIIRTLVKYNNPPEILLLVVDDNFELLQTNEIRFLTEELYPLINHKHIRHELSNRMDGDKKTFSSIVYLTALKYNISSKLKRQTLIHPLLECGSSPINDKSSRRELYFDSGERAYSIEKEVPEKVAAFQSIIRLCHNHDIKPIIIFPPSYQSFSMLFEQRIRELGGEEILYYKYNKDNSIYEDSDFYYDERHLLKKGATIFTGELSEFINTLRTNNDQ